jgi:hypothetical protein
VYDRVVAVRCGTLLQPMLVIDLSASNSIGRAGVVLPKLHYYFMKLPLCQCSLPLIFLEGTKKKYGGVYAKHVINIFGIGKGKWRMLEGGVI